MTMSFDPRGQHLNSYGYDPMEWAIGSREEHEQECLEREAANGEQLDAEREALWGYDSESTGCPQPRTLPFPPRSERPTRP